MENTTENRQKCREFMAVVVETLDSIDMPIQNYFNNNLQADLFMIESFCDGLTVDETIDQILSM